LDLIAKAALGAGFAGAFTARFNDFTFTDAFIDAADLVPDRGFFDAVFATTNPCSFRDDMPVNPGIMGKPSTPDRKTRKYNSQKRLASRLNKFR
jgi:hypothetical protein